MKADQVDKALEKLYGESGARLVFWHDAPGEFADYVLGGFKGELSSVQLLNVDVEGGLAAKLRIERQDQEGRYLVYSTGPAPEPEEDWLLDVRLYSQAFYADIASIWRQELGLASLSLRDHLKERSDFMGSQDRRRKLKRLLQPEDDARAVDVAMIAVVVGSDLARPFDIVRALCHRHVDVSEAVLADAPEVLEQLAKMSLLDRFWELIAETFAFDAPAPSVAGLVRRVLISELLGQAGDTSLVQLAHHRLPPEGVRNVGVFLGQWRDSKAHSTSYLAWERAVSAEQKIKEELSDLELNELRGLTTFWAGEMRLASRLARKVLDEASTIDADWVERIVADRRAAFWLAGQTGEGCERAALADAYRSILSAARLFELYRMKRQSLTFLEPVELLDAYRDELYLFDRHYRETLTFARRALQSGWNLLKDLLEQVESVYDQGFLDPLGVEWSRLLSGGFLEEWKEVSWGAQQAFFGKHIQPHLAKNKRNRAFVIISDALRYEAAVELKESLKGLTSVDAEVKSMLGVLPSYTSLGMASLLPHRELSYNPKGDVLVDGKPVSSTEARGKQLAKVEGMAYQADDLMPLKTDELRKLTEGQRVVYIYHNVIDARGDSSSTEGETFAAVRDCLRELQDLVQLCVNKLSAGKVWITSDHGFLFREGKPVEVGKSKLSHKPDHAFKSKKRYVLGRDLGASPEAHHGRTAVTAGAGGDVEFWVPRGTQLFHFTGGARFVHGGAMPQEVVIPVVTVTQLRGEKREGSGAEKVGISLLGASHKITTPKYRFEFLQTEAVGERRMPLAVKGAVYDGSQAVTTVETLTFESASERMDDRKRAMRLELMGGTFDKSKPYLLILRDAETDAEVLTAPVVIDRSFDDDF